MKKPMRTYSILWLSWLFLFEWPALPPNTSNEVFIAPISSMAMESTIPSTSGSRFQDSLTLLRFFNASNGPNWSYPPNQFASYGTGYGETIRVPNAGNRWDPNTPIDTWTGVSLNADGCVEKLILWWGVVTDEFYCCNPNGAEGVGINGPLSDELANLTSLKELHLAYNGITGPIPAWLGSLTQLEMVSFQYNNLTGPIPAELGNLRKLRQLAFHYNAIDGPFPEELGDLAELEILHFRNNQISGELPSKFCNLSKVYNIDLSNNQLSGDFPACFKDVGFASRFGGLSFLWIPNNQIESLPPDLYTIQYDDPYKYDVDRNKLTFDDIIPNLLVLDEYAPQNFEYLKDTIAIEGTDFTIDLGFDANVSGNVYEWTKDGNPFGSRFENKLTFNNIQQSDAGTYYFEVTNPAAPDLTLFGGPITINIEIDCGTLNLDPPTNVSGDVEYCEEEQPLTLEASVLANQQVYWYDVPTGGIPLLTNSTTFSPPTPGTYYAETYLDPLGCVSSVRTPISLIENPNPTYNLVSKGCQSNTTYAVTFETDANNVVPDFSVATNTSGNEYTITDIPVGQPIQLTLENTFTQCITFIIIDPENNCDACQGITVAPPVNIGNQVYCIGDPVPTLSVTVNAGESVNWYDVPNGGTPIITNTTTYTPMTEGTYYAEAFLDPPGCTSTQRTAVVLTQNKVPTYSLISKNCDSNDTYEVTFETDADDIQTDFGVALNTVGLEYIVSNIPVNQPLLLTLGSTVTGCITSATITPETNCDECQNITVDPATHIGDFGFCPGDPIPSISVTVNAGESVNWYDAPTGGNEVASGTVAFTPTTPGTYYAEAFEETFGCLSTSRTAVTVVEYPLPTYNFDRYGCSADGNFYEVYFSTDLSTIVATNLGIALKVDEAYEVSEIPFGQDLIITLTTIDGCQDIFTQPTRSAIDCDLCLNNPVGPPQPISGDQSYCPGEPIPDLTVQVRANTAMDWYDTEGNFLITGSLYSPTAPGSYFVEARDLSTECTSDRITLVVTPYAPPTITTTIAPECSNDGENYGFTFQTEVTDVDQITISAGNINVIGGGNYQVINVPAGTDVSINVIDPNTTCSANSQVIAPNCGCEGLDLSPPKVIGDSIIDWCSGQSLPIFEVTVPDGASVVWYDGALRVGFDFTFRTTRPGIYYAETNYEGRNCKSATKTEFIVREIDYTIENVSTNCAPDLQTYSLSFRTNAPNANADIVSLTQISEGQYEASGIPAGENLNISLSDVSEVCIIETTIEHPICDCSILTIPDPIPVLDNYTWCENEPILTLEVTPIDGYIADWYDVAVGGEPLFSGERFEISQAQSYYVSLRDRNNDCVGERIDIEVTPATPPTFEIIEPQTCDETLSTYSVTIATSATIVNANIGDVKTGDAFGTFIIENVEAGNDLTLTLFDEISGCSDITVIDAQNCDCSAIFLAPPTSNGDVPWCSNEEIPLLSVAVADGQTVKWYADEVGLTPIGEGLTFLPEQAGTYFAEAISFGCPSARIPVSLIEVLPPTIRSSEETCAANNASYTTIITTDATEVQASAGNISGPINGTFTISDIPAGEDLQVTLLNSEFGCTNNDLIVAPTCDCTNANVMLPEGQENYTFCGDEVGQIEVFVNEGVRVDWYDDFIDGQLVGSGTTLIVTEPGNYFAEAVDELTNCTSRFRKDVEVAFHPIPTYDNEQVNCPQGLTTYTVQFTTDATANDIIISEGNLTDLGDGLFQVTDIASGSDLLITLNSSVPECFNEITVPGVDCGCLDPVFEFVEATTCPGVGFFFDGEERFEPGEYEATFPNATIEGCDSIVTLLLNVEDVIETSENITICPSFGFETCEGIIFEPTTVVCNFTTENGCDSIVIYNLFLEDDPSLDAADDFITLPVPPIDTFINIVDNDLYDPALHSLELFLPPSLGEATLDQDGFLNLIIPETGSLPALDSLSYFINDANCPSLFDQSTVYIRYEDNCLKEALDMLPNSFTPNGDQTNETFDPMAVVLEACQAEVNMSLRILNRWGDTVYFSATGLAWDGKVNGQIMVTQGTYYYIVSVEIPGDEEMFKGPINVLMPSTN